MFEKLISLFTGGKSGEAKGGKTAEGSAGSLRELEGFVDYVVKALVDYPDEVTVAETESEDGGITLVLSVAPSDMGKVIGKRGRIAKAIRSVIKAVSNLDGDRVSVEIQ